MHPSLPANPIRDLAKLRGGVYIDSTNIAALGLRVRHGGCYHGLTLNVDMDLSPFLAIDSRGYPGLPVTCLRDLGIVNPPEGIGAALAENILGTLRVQG